MTYPVKVLGFGDNVVDKYEHLKIMYPGGNAVNFAVYAKRFGAERSAYMGIFGSDREAEHVIGSLEAEQIELIKCVQVIGENGCSKNTVIDGDRVFLESTEGGVRGDMRYALNRFDLEYIRQFDVVHTGNYCYTESQLKVMKEAGIKISFDFSDDSSKEYYEKYARYITYAFCSFDGDDEAAKEHLKFIHSLGPELVSLTRGSKGCIMYDGEQFYTQPATLIDNVVDTMGAGDSFLTSFMDCYLDQLKRGTDRQEAIRTSLKEASKFAAHVCTLNGAFGYGKPYED